MKKVLLSSLFVGFIVFLVFSSGDMRSVLGWGLTAYLALRAFPAVVRDFRWLSRAAKLRNLRYRTSKVDTL